MRITAIIPTYNCSRYLPDAIRSVLAQSRRADEVIIVDDGSTDDTEQSLAPFRDCVTYVKTPNQGAAAARNHGLSLAQGDWIAFLDADDVWAPNKLALQSRVVERDPALLAVCAEFGFIDAAGTRIEARYARTKYRIFSAAGVDWPALFPEAGRLADGQETIDVYRGSAFPGLFLGNFINTSSMLIRKDALLAVGAFSRRRTQEDYETWLKVADRGPIAYIDTPLLDFRRRPQQLTSDDQRLQIARDTADVLRHLEPLASARLDPRTVRDRLTDVHCSLAIAYLGQRRPNLAREVLGLTLTQYGLQSRVVLLWGWSWLPASLADQARRISRRWRVRDQRNQSRMVGGVESPGGLETS